MKKLFLGAALAMTLAVTAAFVAGPVASACSGYLAFGQLISAINHTDKTVAALQQTTAISQDQVALADITPILVPPNPIVPPSPIRAFDNAIARNAQDILALRQTLPNVQLGTRTCDLCATTIGELLQQRNVSLDSVATATYAHSRLTIYFSPGDPCVQNPLSACRTGGGDD